MSSEAVEQAELAERVRVLEEQVARLQEQENHAGDPGESSGPDPALEASTFWALHGLKARTSDPGAVLFTGMVRTSADEPVEWQQGASAESLLEADWSLTADALAALGQPIRLTLLREVLRGRHSAAELSSVESVGTTGQLYHHLRQLVAAGWLRTSGRGRYEVPATRVIPLLVIVAAAQG